MVEFGSMFFMSYRVVTQKGNFWYVSKTLVTLILALLHLSNIWREFYVLEHPHPLHICLRNAFMEDIPNGLGTATIMAILNARVPMEICL